MARKRQIDPSIWVSEQVTNLADPWARLLFIGIFSNADDEGRLKASPTYLKMVIFPREHFSTEQMLEWRQQIVEQGLIQIYTNGSDPTEYLYLPTWHRHQYISKPQPSKLPSHSAIIPEPFLNHSLTIPEPLPNHSAPNGIGNGIGNEDGNGKEDRNGNGKATTTSYEDYVEELKERFPHLNWSLELERFHIHWEGQPKVKRPNWKKRLLNWTTKAEEFRLERLERRGPSAEDEDVHKWPI